MYCFKIKLFFVMITHTRTGVNSIYVASIRGIFCIMQIPTIVTPMIQLFIKRKIFIKKYLIISFENILMLDRRIHGSSKVSKLFLYEY